MADIEVNVRQAKALWSELLDRVAAGEHVTIRRRNRIVARLVPPPSRRQPGRLRGKVWIAPDFDETPENIIEMMEGSCAR
jgi:prevent-host-death family protein